MAQNSIAPKPQIDAVITWVDGASRAHKSARAEHMAREDAPLHENAVNPHRWASDGEVFYCLQSIANHAPWVRRIWLVVADTGPDLSRLPRTVTDKVKLVRHAEIFKGYEDALPTFNSLAIETLLWRIEGLAEHFLYFNDDVFLTAPLDPRDAFRDTAPVLRGKWVDYSDLLADPATRADPVYFNHFMQANAAEIMGFAPNHLFCAAHVVHPMKRSVMARLYGQMPDVFAANARHRFRDLSQFLPQGLHNHACIAENSAVLSSATDNLHIKSGHGAGQKPKATWALLDRVAAEQIKFLCINDLPQLEAIIPDLRPWLADAIGGFETRRIQHTG